MKNWVKGLENGNIISAVNAAKYLAKFILKESQSIFKRFT